MLGQLYSPIGSGSLNSRYASISMPLLNPRRPLVGPNGQDRRVREMSEIGKVAVLGLMGAVVLAAYAIITGAVIVGVGIIAVGIGMAALALSLERRHVAPAPAALTLEDNRDGVPYEEPVPVRGGYPPGIEALLHDSNRAHRAYTW